MLQDDFIDMEVRSLQAAGPHPNVVNFLGFVRTSVRYGTSHAVGVGVAKGCIYHLSVSCCASLFLNSALVHHITSSVRMSFARDGRRSGKM